MPRIIRNGLLLMTLAALLGCYYYPAYPYAYAYPNYYYPYSGSYSAYGSYYGYPSAPQQQPQQYSSGEAVDGYCREYTHTTTIEGRAQQVHGTACREPDG